MNEADYAGLPGSGDVPQDQAEQQSEAQAEHTAAADTSPEPEKKGPSITPLQAVIELARRGRKEILPKLRKILDEHPELVRHYGSLTLQVQENWLRLVSGKDLYLAEALRRNLDTMRSALAGTNASPLERLLVDRLLACHVEMLYFDGLEVQDPLGEASRLARFRAQRQDQAHRHFLSAVKMLATVRQIAAKTNTIQVQLVNPPMVQQPVAPVVPVANGDMPKMSSSSTMRTAEPINRINGGRHNRFDGVRESVGTG